MLEISTSGLMSGDGKRSGPSGLSHRVRPRLYQYSTSSFLLRPLLHPHSGSPTVLIDKLTLARSSGYRNIPGTGADFGREYKSRIA